MRKNDGNLLRYQNINIWLSVTYKRLVAQISTKKSHLHHFPVSPAPFSCFTCAMFLSHLHRFPVSPASCFCLTCAVFLFHLRHVFVPPTQLYLEKAFFNGWNYDFASSSTSRAGFHGWDWDFAVSFMERARDNTEKGGRVTKSHLEARAKIMETCAKIMATCARTLILCAIFLGSSAPITCLPVQLQKSSPCI